MKELKVLDMECSGPDLDGELDELKKLQTWVNGAVAEADANQPK